MAAWFGCAPQCYISALQPSVASRAWSREPRGRIAGPASRALQRQCRPHATWTVGAAAVELQGAPSQASVRREQGPPISAGPEPSATEAPGPAEPPAPAENGPEPVTGEAARAHGEPLASGSTAGPLGREAREPLQTSAAPGEAPAPEPTKRRRRWGPTPDVEGAPSGPSALAPSEQEGCGVSGPSAAVQPPPRENSSAAAIEDEGAEGERKRRCIASAAPAVLASQSSLTVNSLTTCLPTTRTKTTLRCGRASDAWGVREASLLEVLASDTKTKCT